MINLLLVSFWLWIGIAVAVVFFKVSVSDDTLRLLFFITLLLIGVELDFSAKLWDIERQIKKKVKVWCDCFEDD